MNLNLNYSLQGGQLYHWQIEELPDPILFCSKKAIFEKGKSIRGGVPVCWPWFGPMPGNTQHGFARITEWQLKHDYVKDKVRYIQMALYADKNTHLLFPFDFALTIDIIEEKNNLILSLTTINHSSIPMPVTSALHTYFNISHLDKIHVEGLEGQIYIDKTDHGTHKTDKEHQLKISKEEDRIYLQAPLTKIVDPEYGRTITIAHNAPNIVLWNPGPEKVTNFADLEQREYQNFICIESGHVLEPKTLQPQEEWIIEQNIFVEKI